MKIKLPSETIISLDPSGNYAEGKGTTGITLLKDKQLSLYEIKASEETHGCAERYWNHIVQFILKTAPDQLVFEGYRLYNHKGMKADTQTNSTLETPQLIGVLRYMAFRHNIPFHIYFAADVKTRWSDEILQRYGVLDEKNCLNGKRTNKHQRDSLRHMLHHVHYKMNRKEEAK